MSLTDIDPKTLKIICLVLSALSVALATSYIHLGEFSMHHLSIKVRNSSKRTIVKLINQTGLIAYVQENTFSEPIDLQKWMKKKENEYHQSKERIARICSKWERKPLNETSFVKRLLFVDKYKVVLCKNDKVGSNTWLKHLLRLLPNEVQSKYINATKLYSAGILKEFKFKEQLPNMMNPTLEYFKRNHFFAFSFVRHPFDRLVSAYVDKVIKNKAIWLKDHPTIGSTNFATFAQYVVSKCEQFANNKTLMNTHWKPYSSKCQYCEMDYDVIGRAETFIDDTRYIFLKNNLTEKLPLSAASFRSHPDPTDPLRSLTKPLDGRPDDRTLKYFSEVTDPNLIIKLYKCYKKDFELFNYNLQGLVIDESQLDDNALPEANIKKPIWMFTG